MDKVEVLELLIEVKQNYSNVDVSDAAVDRHLEHLADMPFETALRNVRQHVRDSVYPPKIAEIRAGWSDYGARMKQAAREYIAEQEENRKRAVPPPQRVRDQIAEIKRRLAAEQSGS